MRWNLFDHAGVSGQIMAAATHLPGPKRRDHMRSIIYIVGLVVVVLAILSFIGLA